MGSADIVPGVSGGTIALITGIYEHLVKAIKSINLLFLVYLLRGFSNKKYLSKAKNTFLKIDFKFLIPLVLGITVAFLSLANLVSFLIESYPTYTYSFFFGLILSSSFFVYKSNKKEVTMKSIFFILIGFAISFFVVGLQSVNANHLLLFVFVAGMISFCAMILPGISGAFMLLLLGQYTFMLNVVRDITSFNFSKLPFAFIYGIGGIVGLLIFSNLLSYLFKKYRGETISFVIGLMIGALRKPAFFVMDNPSNFFLTMLSIVIGLGVVSAVSYYASHFEMPLK